MSPGTAACAGKAARCLRQAANVSYQTARTAAMNGGLDNWVTAAFIVDDQGFAGTAVTLTGAGPFSLYRPLRRRRRRG